MNIFLKLQTRPKKFQIVPNIYIFLNLFIAIRADIWYYIIYVNVIFYTQHTTSFIFLENEIYRLNGVVHPIKYAVCTTEKGEYMAKDMLDAICAAEEECRKRESDAKKEAEQAVTQAKQDAARLILQREEKAHSDAEAELDKARAEGEKALAQAKADAEKECDRISALAEKKRPAVIQKAADALLG